MRLSISRLASPTFNFCAAVKSFSFRSLVLLTQKGFAWFEGVVNSNDGLNDDPQYWLGTYPSKLLSEHTDGPVGLFRHWHASVLPWSFFFFTHVLLRTESTQSREKGSLCTSDLKKAAYGNTTLMCGLHCRSHRAAPGFTPPSSSSSHCTATPQQSVESR